MELSVAAATPLLVAGSVVDVRVDVRALSSIEVSGVEVALVAQMRFIHREAGMLGTASMGRAKRTEVHSSKEVPGPWPLAAGESVTLPVRLDLPEAAPGTTRCDLIQIEWSVRGRLEAIGYSYAQARREVVVLSTASDLAHVAVTPPVSDSRAIAELAFENLSSRFLVPGRPVSGTLAITPLRAGTVRAARVALLMYQHVHRGDWVASRSAAYQENSRATQIGGVILAEHLELAPAADVRLPFTLPVRRILPAPSLDTPAFSLRWVLRADLDRGLRRAPFTELELHGRTVRGW